MKRLDLNITERARAWIANCLAGHEAGSVLMVGHGTFRVHSAAGLATGKEVSRWRHLVLAKSQAAEIERSSSVTGEGIYVTNDGISLCVPERSDIARLAGKTLDVVDGTLVVAGRTT